MRPRLPLGVLSAAIVITSACGGDDSNDSDGLRPAGEVPAEERAEGTTMLKLGETGDLGDGYTATVTAISRAAAAATTLA